VKRSPLNRGKPLARGKGLKRGTSRLKRTRLKPISDKRREEIPERQKTLEVVFARDKRQCRAAAFFPDMPCQGPLDGHEPLSRARGGNPLDPDEVVTVCRGHHDHIHAHPEESAALGLLEHSWDERED